MKTKKRLPRQKRTPKSGWFWAGSTQARLANLWLAEEGDPRDPIWSVYSQKTGRLLARYSPKTGLWDATFPRKVAGQESSFAQVFTTIRELE